MYIIYNIITNMFQAYSGGLQGDILITRIQIWLTVSLTLHNN